MNKSIYKKREQRIRKKLKNINSNRFDDYIPYTTSDPGLDYSFSLWVYVEDSSETYPYILRPTTGTQYDTDYFISTISTNSPPVYGWKKSKNSSFLLKNYCNSSRT